MDNQEAADSLAKTKENVVGVFQELFAGASLGLNPHSILAQFSLSSTLTSSSPHPHLILTQSSFNPHPILTSRLRVRSEASDRQAPE